MHHFQKKDLTSFKVHFFVLFLPVLYKKHVPIIQTVSLNLNQDKTHNNQQYTKEIVPANAQV